ncbi:MAG TPA: J domain-containing protein [Candidatus Sericytochromatia bacterium]
MNQNSAKQKTQSWAGRYKNSYYALLGLHPAASALEIRRAYRELSKRYHPDTTELPGKVATAKFQQLNEAYATLSSPERRQAYDQKIGYSRISVIQAPSNLNPPVSQPKYSSSAYLDPTDRPLSAGEMFALFILGLTFLGCVLLAIAIGLTRGESAFQVSGLNTNTIATPSAPVQQLVAKPQKATDRKFEIFSAPSPVYKLKN